MSFITITYYYLTAPSSDFMVLNTIPAKRTIDQEPSHRQFLNPQPKMCKVTRTRYACRHTVTEYKSTCSDVSGRCEKEITNSSSRDQCAKCAPDNRHKNIIDLYAKYSQELKKLIELAKAEDCNTMVMQLEEMIKGLPEQRIKALTEVQEKTEIEAAAKTRIEEELVQESRRGW
ncbi:hypothetical protein V8C42DRAFT_309171 [Trichoderma barbatum]